MQLDSQVLKIKKSPRRPEMLIVGVDEISDFRANPNAPEQSATTTKLNGPNGSHYPTYLIINF